MFLNFEEGGLFLTFEITEEKRLYLLHLSDRPYQNEVIEKSKSAYLPLSFHLSGSDTAFMRGQGYFGVPAGRKLCYVSHSLDSTPDGSLLTFVLEDGEVRVRLHYVFYNGIRTVRSWTEIENVSQETVTVEYLSSFALTGWGTDDATLYLPLNSWMREVNWQKQKLSEAGFPWRAGQGSNRFSVSNCGSWSTKDHLPMAALEFSGEKEAMIWQIEHNGSWEWEITDSMYQWILLCGGPNANDHQWYKRLAPGECFESVKAAVAFGTDFNDVLGELTRYRRKIIRNSPTDKKLPVIFNDYMNCLWAKPTTELELPVIDRAAELGAEYYCMDAGWYADGVWWDTVGLWEPVAWRFPNGMQEVFDRVREKGMIPGIWVEIESVGIHCPILDRFDDDCFIMRNGKRVIDRQRYQLDFRNPKVLKFATDVIDRLVSEYGIGYFKIDYNIDIGVGTEVNSDSFGDGLLACNRAYLAWIDGILAKYPELVLENCSSGGMRMDYASLAHSAIQSVTDQSGCVKMSRIAAAAATAVLPEQAAIWAYPKAEDELKTVQMNMVNAMPLRVHLSGEVLNLSEEKLEAVKEGIACYKNIRKDISSSIPFYPLGVPQYGSEWYCSAYRTANGTYYCVWRADAEADTVQIPLSDSEGNAKILYPSAGGATVRAEGNTLSVRLPERQSAVVIHTER